MDERERAVPEQSNSERDRLAERWLIDQHSPEWYIGDASDAEWKAAYAAVDHWPSRGDGINADHFIGG